MGARFVLQNENLQQQVMLSGIINGTAVPEQWGESARQVDFFDLKADVEAILSLGGNLLSYRFVAEQHPSLHPGQSARIYKQNQPIGWVGTLHPNVAKSMGVKSKCIVFELEFDAIADASVPKYKNLSKFPAIRRDIAIIVDDALESSAIINNIRHTAEKSLSENSRCAVELFDVYIGEGVEAGKKSLAISLTMQEQSRTLTDEEIETLIEAVLAELKQQYGVKLRD